MIGLIAMARQSPFIRLALAGLGGLLAGVALYASNKKLDKRHRQEIAIVGGIATAIIIWLLLGPHGIGSGHGQMAPVSVGGVTVEGATPLSLGPLTINVNGIPNLNYDPSLLFYNPPKEQTATTCGCAERASAWGEYIQSLWQTLDQVFPQGPGGDVNAFTNQGVPTFTG